MEQVKITFECSYGNCRSGFNHDCVATTSEGRTATAHAHYINRTWEAYPFDSVKHSAVCNLIEQEVNEFVSEYKRTHNNGRLPKNFRKDLRLQVRRKYADNPYCPSEYALSL